MSPAGKLLGFGFRQTLSGDASQVIGLVEQWFAEPSQTLPKAFSRANERAWQVLAIALAGEGVLKQINNQIASGEDRGIREQVQQFLTGTAMQFAVCSSEMRRLCLTDLKQARKSGLLSVERLTGQEVARQTLTFQRFVEPSALVHGAHATLVGVADDLAPRYPNLAQYLRNPVQEGTPLVVAAFAFFFRREIKTNDELADMLLLDGLRQLAASHSRAFQDIDKALVSLGDQFDNLIEQLGQIEQAAVATIPAMASPLAMLDLRVDLQRVNQAQVANAEELRQLIREAAQRLTRLGMQSGEVQHHHSLSIQSDEEREAVRSLVQRFRLIPETQQQRLPALLNGLGKLEIAMGDFDAARATFMKVAGSITNPDARAEAYNNAYRAALEKKQWNQALAAVREAAMLVPARFAPFPIQRYEPKRLLGAGGFGAAFLCHDRNLDEEVVVKALHGGNPGSITTVFHEARALRSLSHEGIIKIRDCDYADPATRSRPFLVMDYFPGMALEEVARCNPLPLSEFLPLALQLAQAMQAAHGQGLLHRDLKPGNVLIQMNHGSWKMKIIDFGLAVWHSAGESRVTVRPVATSLRGESFAGTLKYAPPEQIGELPGVKSGPYSDVYSFGKLCCYALFRTTEPKSRHWDGVPKKLARLLESCLEEKPTDRPQSFREVVGELAKIRSRPLEFVPDVELVQPVFPVAQVTLPAQALASHPTADRHVVREPAPAQVPLQCRVCQKESKSTHKFCTRCGVRLGETLPRPNPPQVGPRDKPTRLLGGLLAVLAIITFPAAYLLSRLPKGGEPSFSARTPTGVTEMSRLSPPWMVDERALGPVLTVQDKIALQADGEAYQRTILAIGSSEPYIRQAAPLRSSHWHSAAESGDALAQMLWGECLQLGVAVRGFLQVGDNQPNDAEALAWYRKAADQGLALAQTDIGDMYASGHGVLQNDAEAVKWYVKAAAQGEPSAQVKMGDMQQLGRGVRKDDVEAVKWYRKAAEQGSADGQNSLGSMYMSGKGVTASDREAVVWFRKAADQGYSPGQLNLGVMCAAGRGLLRDDSEAVKWYRLAAEQGNAAAQNQLGVMYDAGRGVTLDVGEAVKWFRKAAEQGDDWGQFNLGHMYASGRGVVRDDDEAVQWYRLGAEQGNAACQNHLGIMYETGRGVLLEDVEEAVKWFRKAAEQGDGWGQHNLGLMYQEGRGVAKSYNEALQWYRKSADQGNAEAQHKLGSMYEAGQGVKANKAEAKKWYRKAAEQGNQQARAALRDWAKIT